MQLDKFIEETLVGIQRGVKNANIAIAKQEKTPERTNGQMQYHMDSNRGDDKNKNGSISFDVAVTVISGKNVEGGGKVSVVGLSLGAGKTVSGSEQNVSRIKFQVDPFNSLY
ncbi:hypothetical protein A3F27_00370 [Candidatus Kaiserbacteria bacterium RIFCSPHIGHO2_12_FULL_53_13]|uniref:Uncharacterized protein n=1 Tax=Candidatus Kaiserbacteria bacterium RIFCSPHIGHO2_12_FULL_53_13 TaxID=1798502 RepID=A0A1F6E7I0_9BACT|nr:MAG: hypothetical protein A3F27_00370 [Candidatus Kaiserbacteria bacterium RIFCSPHIGHO2_12_FULL_53_13]OGG74415.1 MAG: hypothetical protein A3A37_02075 [Candidatus Kaiserbacteria bacterium RIFCSPLOWO2_01_FULL_52_36]